MRLEGTLDAFGLPDILQLLAFTRKTGALRLSAPPAAGVVHVRAGAICAASSDTRRQVLARRVVGAGLVGDDALQAAVAVAADGPTGVVAALIEAGAVDRDAVLPLAAEQTTDAVGELLRWSGGEFSFVVDDADPDALPLAMPVDEVIAEGQRRLDVWAELTAVIPSPDTALALTVAPAEEPRCSREEWGLLALVDGVRTVAEIVALLGRGEFAVMRALAGLVSRGLLVVPGAAGPGGGFAELHRRQALLASLESGGATRVDDLDVAVRSFADEPSPTAPTLAPAEDPVFLPPPRETAVPTVAPAVTVVAPVDGANALAPDLMAGHAGSTSDETPPSRPSLTLAPGPHDAPVTRALLIHVPNLFAND